MSPEQREQQMKSQVDEVFYESFGSSKGRIIMAAFAIGNQVGVLRGLTEERARRHEDVPSAPIESGSAASQGLDEKLAPIHPDGVGPKIEDDTDIKTLFGELVESDTDEILNARLALDAAVEGVRAVYGLSERQARRAKTLAEKTFWLFNITDPTQK